MSAKSDAVHAARGARYLDRIAPRWYDRVDPLRANFSSAERCILGQVLGDFYLAPGWRRMPMRAVAAAFERVRPGWLWLLEALTLPIGLMSGVWTVRRGFQSFSPTYCDLRAAWLNEVAARRELAAASRVIRLEPESPALIR